MALACQVVNGDGVFGQQDVEQFFGASQMEDVGRDYQVVAIMGPQSSGKSTLLNHVVCDDVDALSVVHTVPNTVPITPPSHSPTSVWYQLCRDECNDRSSTNHQGHLDGSITKNRSPTHRGVGSGG